MPTTRAAKKATASAPDPNLADKLDAAFGPEPTPAELAAAGRPDEPEERPFVAPFWLGNSSKLSDITGHVPKYIFPALHAAMCEIRAVGKTGYNQQQNYNFRGIDGVINAAGPAFRKHGIIPTPKLKKVSYRDTKTTGGKDTREVIVEVDYTFYGLDGSSITITVPGESLDQSDKGSAKAMSVAYRIALIQLLAIPTDEPDPDASYHTRDGAGPMVESMVDWLRRMVPGRQAPVADLTDLWRIVLDHSAADRTAPGDEDGRTWYEVFAARWAAEVNAVETYSDGRMLGEAMTKANVKGWHLGDSTLGRLLDAKAEEMIATHRATHEKIVGMIAAASTLEQCDQVADAITEAFEDHRLQRSSKADVEGELRAVLHDRRAKIADEIMATPEAPEPAGGPDPRSIESAEAHRAEQERRTGELDPDNPDHYTVTGFPKLSGNQAALLQVRGMAEGILDGEKGTTAEDRISWLMTQCTAVDQLVIVRDTIAKAFGRDQKIGEAAHKRLLDELRGYCQEHGVVGLVTE